MFLSEKPHLLVDGPNQTSIFMWLTCIVRGALCNGLCRDVVGWLIVGWLRSLIVANQCVVVL